MITGREDLKNTDPDRDNRTRRLKTKRNLKVMAKMSEGEFQELLSRGGVQSEVVWQCMFGARAAKPTLLVYFVA